MKAEEEEPSQSGQNQNGDTVLNRSDTGRDRYQQRQHERRCSENSVPSARGTQGFAPLNMPIAMTSPLSAAYSCRTIEAVSIYLLPVYG